jgi:hypothetical protein
MSGLVNINSYSNAPPRGGIAEVIRQPPDERENTARVPSSLGSGSSGANELRARCSPSVEIDNLSVPFSNASACERPSSSGVTSSYATVGKARGAARAERFVGTTTGRRGRQDGYRDGASYGGGRQDHRRARAAPTPTGVLPQSIHTRTGVRQPWRTIKAPRTHREPPSKNHQRDPPRSPPPWRGALRSPAPSSAERTRTARSTSSPRGVSHHAFRSPWEWPRPVL